MFNPVSIEDQVRAAEREAALRRRVYPRWVGDGKMTQAKADAEIAAMEAIIETLKSLVAARTNQPKLGL
jgi:hypothetical protein